jgi:hypothetical protein
MAVSEVHAVREEKAEISERCSPHITHCIVRLTRNCCYKNKVPEEQLRQGKFSCKDNCKLPSANVETGKSSSSKKSKRKIARGQAKDTVPYAVCNVRFCDDAKDASGQNVLIASCGSTTSVKFQMMTAWCSSVFPAKTELRLQCY